MKTKQLAKRIAAEYVPGAGDKDCLVIDRAWLPEATNGLRRTTIEVLTEVHGALCRAIPNDFDFRLVFDGHFVSVQPLFADGKNDGAGFEAVEITLDSSGYSRLRAVDWNTVRAEAISGTQLHDQITDIADDLPGGIPPTSELRKIHSERFLEFERVLNESKIYFAILACSTDEDGLAGFEGYEVVVRKDKPSLMYDLPNLLACEYQVIAIAIEGKLLDPVETDSYLDEALNCLGPISRAKAEGRFQGALELMRGGSQ